MSNDIVARLRVWSDNAKEQDAPEIVVGLCQAADEIERLRKERDDAQQLVNAAADVIERLRKERDDARWRLCKVLGDIRDVWGDEIAIEKGWTFE